MFRDSSLGERYTTGEDGVILGRGLVIFDRNFQCRVLETELEAAAATDHGYSALVKHSISVFGCRPNVIRQRRLPQSGQPQATDHDCVILDALNRRFNSSEPIRQKGSLTHDDPSRGGRALGRLVLICTIKTVPTIDSIFVHISFPIVNDERCFTN